jgi:tetratricopeptide (TPR) repeat protein
LIRLFLAGILLVVCSGRAAAEEQGQLDASRSLFTVLAAINAVGYDADLDSAANHPLRSAMRNVLASKNLPCLPELRNFFSEHRQKDGTAELSQYVSYALVVGGPPKFAYRLRPNELPPDVIPLEGLTPLMTRFYQEAGIDDLWRKAQPAFEEAIARYHAPVIRAVTEMNAYLRNATSGVSGSRFQIYIDLLGAPNQIQMRSYSGEYFVVLTPSPEPQVDDVRHAYLHYLLDPLATRNSEDLLKKKAIGDYALAAPFLEEYYKSDFLLLATECLIKAVESRLLHGPQQAKQALVQKALSEGFILTPFFADRLPAYEKQEQSMRFYFPSLVAALDMAKEDRRLEKVEFSQERPIRKAKVVPAERKVEPPAAYKTMEEAEQASRDHDLAKAKQGYLRVLQETEEKPLQAKAYYGLGRIAALEKDPELAEKLFQRTLETSPDPQVKAYSLLYLGRLADLAGEREQASRYYQGALAVEGAPAGARKAAEQGLKESFKKDK